MTSSHVVAVVQARMSSTRLPGKVLRPLGARTVLEWVVRAASTARAVDEVVIATSVGAADDAIALSAEDLGVRCVRGSEEDVLSRFVLAAAETDADAIVRLTADCPFLDPRLIDQVVGMWRQEQSLGYVSTTLERTLPRGLDVELVSASALAWADAMAEGYDRTHVTSLVYRPDSPIPRAGIVVAPSKSRLRVTLDETRDAEALDAVAALIPDEPPRWRALVELLEAHPEIVAMNAEVKQKNVREG